MVLCWHHHRSRWPHCLRAAASRWQRWLRRRGACSRRRWMQRRSCRRHQSSHTTLWRGHHHWAAACAVVGHQPPCWVIAGERRRVSCARRAAGAASSASTTAGHIAVSISQQQLARGDLSENAGRASKRQALRTYERLAVSQSLQLTRLKRTWCSTSFSRFLVSAKRPREISRTKRSVLRGWNELGSMTRS